MKKGQFPGKWEKALNHLYTLERRNQCSRKIIYYAIVNVKNFLKI